MKQGSALIIAILITLLILGNYLFFYDFSSGREKVIIARAIDGDTLELEDGRQVRLLNINTPEKKDFFYNEASEFLKSFENQQVELESKGIDMYGRILGNIYSQEYVNLEIVKRGFAHSYMVDEEELKNFKRAEKNAFENEIGIWKRSEYYGCLDIEINKYEEYVKFEILCELDLKGWQVKDESTKRYVFDRDYESLTLYSGKGENDKDKAFWGRENVWNDDKDSIFIRDADGFLVYYDSYGY